MLRAAPAQDDLSCGILLDEQLGWPWQNNLRVFLSSMGLTLRVVRRWLVLMFAAEIALWCLRHGTVWRRRASRSRRSACTSTTAPHGVLRQEPLRGADIRCQLDERGQDSSCEVSQHLESGGVPYGGNALGNSCAIENL